MSKPVHLKIWVGHSEVDCGLFASVDEATAYAEDDARRRDDELFYQVLDISTWDIVAFQYGD